MVVDSGSPEQDGSLGIVAMEENEQGGGLQDERADQWVIEFFAPGVALTHLMQVPPATELGTGLHQAIAALDEADFSAVIEALRHSEKQGKTQSSTTPSETAALNPEGGLDLASTTAEMRQRESSPVIGLASAAARIG
jgi:hypothetical protein